MIKKILKIVLVLFAIVVVGAALSGGGSENKSSESKTSESKPPEEIKWNMNLEDENAAVANAKLCISAMRQMNDVVANAKPVSAPDVLNNPAQYVGQVLEFSAMVIGVENFPEGSTGTKIFGGKGHAMEAVDYGVLIVAYRKGSIGKDAVGKEIKIVGMLAGIQPTDDMGKSLLIIGNPK